MSAATDHRSLRHRRSAGALAVVALAVIAPSAPAQQPPAAQPVLLVPADARSCPALRPVGHDRRRDLRLRHRLPTAVVLDAGLVVGAVRDTAADGGRHREVVYRSGGPVRNRLLSTASRDASGPGLAADGRRDTVRSRRRPDVDSDTDPERPTSHSVSPERAPDPDRSR